jgi:peptidoglycan biosynthesis protein MviN/MurJ (putative lipid II flippase)
MQKNHSNMSNMGENHYRHLLIMAALSFIAMYILMNSMVNIFGNVYNSLNEFYMAGLMTAPMVLIELVVMRTMYSNKQFNLLITVVSVVALIGFFLGIRQQAAISDKQFLRSMIPHHAGAILMCKQASIQDPEIQDLCKTIIASQQSEIDQMKGILQRLDK